MHWVTFLSAVSNPHSFLVGQSELRFRVRLCRQNKPPLSRGGFRTSDCAGRLSNEGEAVLPPSIRHEANSSKAKDHHGPCGGFRDGACGIGTETILNMVDFNSAGPV